MTNTKISYLDHEVINEDHKTVGKVTDVLYEHADTEPKWLVVKPGLMQAERIVPIERSYVTEDGNIVVPFDKKWIKSGPKAGDHVMTADTEHEAAEHYDVAEQDVAQDDVAQ